MRNTLLSMLLVFILTSCKKETTQPFYINQTFVTENTMIVHPIRLFSRNGEITDSVFIANFIQRHITQIGHTSHFTTGTTSIMLDPAWSMKLTFREDNSATVERNALFLFPYTWETHQADVVLENGNILRVTERDSINSLMYTDTCNDMLNKMLTYLPNGTALTSGSTIYCRWNYYFPVVIGEDKITIPTITRLTVHNNPPGLYCYIHRWMDERNMFNPTVINLLGPVDTIACQISDIQFRRL